MNKSKRFAVYCKRYRVIGIVTIMILIAWAGWLSFACVSVGADAQSNLGVLGDSFGVINTLFSGLAFAGVVWAILLQMQELRIQRQDLRLTRVEVKKSAEAHEQTVKLMKHDQDERRLQSQRAATLILQRSGTVSESPGRIEFKMKNLGSTAFDVHVPESEDSRDGRYGFYTEPHEILNAGSEITICCRVPLPLGGDRSIPQRHGDHSFTIGYIDTTGCSRRQEYLCEFDSDGYPVRCLDAGLMKKTNAGGMSLRSESASDLI